VAGFRKNGVGLHVSIKLQQYLDYLHNHKLLTKPCIKETEAHWKQESNVSLNQLKNISMDCLLEPAPSRVCSNLLLREVKVHSEDFYADYESYAVLSEIMPQLLRRMALPYKM
jgi:hypothetical protein